jgi:hypothetical protein
MPRKYPWLLPYGAYLTHDSAVLFDREYRPIVRFTERGVIACDPTEWIKHDGRLYHYRDGTAPRRDRGMRARLLALVESIPVLAAEIRRRDAR